MTCLHVSPLPLLRKLALFAAVLLLVGCGSSSTHPFAMAEEQQPAASKEVAADDEPAAKEKEVEHPFRARIPAPEFPKDMEWMNTEGPLELKDLKGKYVLLDFWTYCCINCIHILPELKKLEHEFPNQLVVVGVHSAKFDTEKEAKNISEAILRYEIEHPVVNDDEMKIWNSFSVSSWPTMYLIDPEGNVVYLRRGEFKADDIREVLNRSMPYYRNNGSLDETPIQFDLLAYNQQPTQLRFPGKILADEKSNRLFISDSNHNRIVVTSLDGQLQDVIGSGEVGSADGGYASAQFDHPQGMALIQDTLYVADTENHLIRKVDLKEKQVSTIAGVGEQARNNWPGVGESATISSLPDRFVGLPKTTAINSPWDLWSHGDSLYIAMAGPHQIWKMTLDEKEIGPYAGNGREDIVDGSLLPPVPYQQGYSSFAQPSGLTSDGKSLFVADSEGSSIRAVPFDPEGSVRTVIGTAHLPYGRLFSFGDVDGPPKTAKLQHALGVCYVDGVIYTADTYNNKIKAVDATTGDVKTIAGTGEPGIANDPAQFDEPAGISHAAGKLYIADTNNHMIRVMDLETKETSTLEIKGLKPMPVKKRPEVPEGAIQK
ncbi:Thiol-disulfide oxidoreductase ResA [Bremerella volcania]|uniref:Thiol-disulfide oxidoreductase ResA n=1 Tax=Bremerella volcania TaxID=2527984 RepID=A0A518CDH2_9BACT|nr:thioredoxin-like domain-containing protein [Bremerella volcania]QDU77273.1 Thiol-disulfide oxidoreductase ResA [Bremerella volcania]